MLHLFSSKILTVCHVVLGRWLTMGAYYLNSYSLLWNEPDKEGEPDQILCRLWDQNSDVKDAKTSRRYSGVIICLSSDPAIQTFPPEVLVRYLRSLQSAVTGWRSLHWHSPSLSGPGSSPHLTRTSCQWSPGPRIPASWKTFACKVCMMA